MTYNGNEVTNYMATYVVSDIHGEYDMFVELLEKIRLREEGGI